MTGNQLREKRESFGISQVALARPMRVNHSYISMLESGDRPITPELERRFSEVFDSINAEHRELARVGREVLRVVQRQMRP